jgi:hypothetical protein
MREPLRYLKVGFEFLAAVTMKNAVFWDVAHTAKYFSAVCVGCQLVPVLFLAHLFLSP